MRLVRYADDGGVHEGVVVEQHTDSVTVRDLPAGVTLLDVVGGSRVPGGGTASSRRVPLTSLLAPLVPGKLICAAMNYHEHVAEVTDQAFDKSAIVPKLFLKPSTCLLPPHGTLVLPADSDTVDWEIELAAVIAERVRDVPADAALASVGAYCVINDVSARTMHWGMAERAPSHWAEFFDWLMGKWPDGFAPLGPWLVTSDEIPDPQALHLELSVNGIVRQSASTAQMIFGVAELVSFASRFMTLEPGDVVATGTPSGVGAASGTFLAAGDVMEGTIEGLGTIVTKVAGRT